MASPLLKCSICPKKPSFSDISHLLTHVGSKGHLSYLHKLQVRSHQEIAAGQELAAYDRWYQQHGLGHLLSERMLYKEARKGNKRGRVSTNQRNIKNGSQQSAPNVRLPVPPYRHSMGKNRQLHPPRLARGSRTSRLSLYSEDDSNYDDSPTKQQRSAPDERFGFRRSNVCHSRYKARKVHLDSIKRTRLHTSPELRDSVNELSCADVSDPVTPKADDESPRLKGVQWPGMNLFDAATEGMKKRRNQKKDGSILEHMEKSSELVMPAEAIYSPGGTWQKTRVITGNVEDTSPLRGETPVPKPVRRRRYPLVERDGNIACVSPARLQGKRRSGYRFQVPAELVIQQSSSIGIASPDSRRRFSPTEDENNEFKLTVENLRNGKRRGNVAVFDDSRYPEAQPSRTALVSRLNDTRSHRPTIHGYGQQAAKKPQMQFMTTPWLQPQYQQSTDYHQMYTTIDEREFRNPSHSELNTGKENIEPDFFATDRITRGQASTAPGESPVKAQDHFGSVPIPRLGTFGLGGLNMFEDPFGYSTNPLNTAFHSTASNLESPFLTEGSAFSGANNMESVNSPDGTVSDHGGYAHGQSVFASNP